MLTEEYGKVGSKGELYPSVKIRKKLGLKPNNPVKYRISPKGYLIVEIVETAENLLKQEQGYSNEAGSIS